MDPTDRDPAGTANLHRIVRCPACGGDSVYSPSNPARPFCSDRCKNMDFGAWASETFRVPTQVAPDDLMLGETPRH